MVDPLSLIAVGAFTYPGLIVLTVLAQPLAALACGGLIAAGTLPFWPAFACLVGVDLVMDIFWYVLGRHQGSNAQRLILRYLRLDETHAEMIRKRFRAHDVYVLVGAKILGGAGIMPFILFTAGASHIPFRRYLAFTALGELVWTIALVGLGYWYSQSITGIASTIDRISFSLGVVVVIGLIWYMLKRYVRIDA